MNWRLMALAALTLGIVLLAPAMGDWSTLAAQGPEFPLDDPFGAPPAPENATAPKLADPAAEELIQAFPPTSDQQIGYALNNIVLLICAVLVFFMQAGFAMVESGFNSSKQTVNILFKNALGVCVGILCFWCIGHGLMHPTQGTRPPVEPNPYLAFGGTGINVGLAPAEAAAESADRPPRDIRAMNSQVDWLFQAALAMFAATIISGALGGRMKFGACMMYTAFVTAFIYPISGYWAWGGGWLEQAGFHDLAGSTVVHALGGFAGLAGAIVLGPRIGRYSPEGKPMSVPGHSLPLATLGVFLLMIGWYGFNVGGHGSFSSAGDADRVMLIAVNTTLASAAGGVLATFLSWILFSKPDLSMTLNGILAGLVGITASGDGVSNGSAMLIGGVAGVLVIAGIITLDKLQIDDPVGAFPVHGLCGVWGGLAVAIFGGYEEGVGTLAAQLKGILFICGWSFGTMFVLFSMLRSMGFLRVRAEDEQRGLDMSEHGMSAYAA